MPQTALASSRSSAREDPCARRRDVGQLLGPGDDFLAPHRADVEPLAPAADVDPDHGLRVGQVEPHEEVVDVAALEQERLAQGAVDLEAATRVEVPGAAIAAEDAQPQPSIALVPGAIDRGVEQLAADPLATPRRVDREPFHFERVARRLELRPRPEQEVADEALAV